jgi:hypothetical protein
MNTETKQLSVEEGNRLIHIWLGKSYETDVKIQILKYHSSWDWLMPVVKKIRSLWNEETLDLQLLIEDSNASKISHLRVWSELDSVYNAVIEFIQWYNNQSKI